MAELIMGRDFVALKHKLNEAEKRAPDKVLKRFNRLGNRVKKELVQVTPVGSKKRKKRLKGKWRAEKATVERGEYVKKIRNTASYYHLVERGHRVVPRRATSKTDRRRQYRVTHRTGGKKFVEGRFFTKKKLEELEPTIHREYDKLLDEILEDIL